MPSEADIRECERLCQQHRQENACRFLRIDETKKSDDADIKLANQVLAAAKGDGSAFDRALNNVKVQDLFRAGVLFLAKT